MSSINAVRSNAISYDPSHAEIEALASRAAAAVDQQGGTAAVLRDGVDAAPPQDGRPSGFDALKNENEARNPIVVGAVAGWAIGKLLDAANSAFQQWLANREKPSGGATAGSNPQAQTPDGGA